MSAMVDFRAEGREVGVKKVTVAHTRLPSVGFRS